MHHLLTISKAQTMKSSQNIGRQAMSLPSDRHDIQRRTFIQRGPLTPKSEAMRATTIVTPRITRGRHIRDCLKGNANAVKRFAEIAR
jgi:hypothetical protein